VAEDRSRWVRTNAGGGRLRHQTRLEAGLVVSEGNDMQRTEKEQVVAELVEQLRSTESLIVADYRGLTNADLVELRTKVRSSGGRFQVV
jgi:hypothetical protein